MIEQIFKPGDLSPGLVIDHLCRNRACCNPDHLREVDHYVNTMENSEARTYLNSIKNHCKRGHDLTTDNVIFTKGTRSCRQCKKYLNSKEYKDGLR